MPDYKVEFNESEHIYTVNGSVKKSVTQILGEEGLTKYFNCDPWYLERGSEVHRCTALMDIGLLVWNTVDERIRGYLEAYLSFLRHSEWIFEHIEKPLYHPLYDYTGTPDRFLPLLDIKCGEGHVIQLEGYAELLRANNIDPGREGYMLNLNENGKYSLKPHKYDRTLRGVFLSACTLNKYKEGMNGR